MKKQTKLVAVLSTAALLAIGASMTSFAATGWAEEDGTWVYYDRDVYKRQILCNLLLYAPSETCRSLQVP